MLFSIFRRRKTAGGVAVREMPPFVMELREAWPPLAGKLPGLTADLEREFRFGQGVMALDGQYRLGGNLKGGSSAMWVPTDRAAFDAYAAWRGKDGIPRGKNRRAFRRLDGFLAKRGVTLVDGSFTGPGQRQSIPNDNRGPLYQITFDILSKLPQEHVGREEFRILQLGGWGPDGAKGSAYENGAVMMYDFAVNGARRTYAGLLLHELGHLQETAFGGDILSGLEADFEAIAVEGAVLGVEYLLDANSRRQYQLRVFEEFLAETYMIYASQGGRLRDFVSGLRGRVAAAWERTYGVFKAAFGGVEYA